MKKPVYLLTQHQIGKIGQHLVCAHLISEGHDAFFAGESLPYDVLVDVDKKIFKVQVKTSRDKYSFYTNKKYLTEVDIFAFVNLESKQIGFINVKEKPFGKKFTNPNNSKKDYDYLKEYTFEKCLENKK